MNVSLTPQLESLIQDKISTGMYTNASEVIRDALRRLDEKDEYRELQKLLTPRIEAAKQGEFVEYDINNIITELDSEDNYDK